MSCFKPVVTVAGDGVNKAVAEVNMIVFNVWTWDIEDYFIILIPDAHIRAHLARVTAHAWGGELNPCGYMPAVRVAGGQRQPAADGGHAIAAGGGQQL